MSLHKRKIAIASKKATHWQFQRLKKFLQNKTHQKIISLALVLALITNASPAIIPDFLQGRTDIFSRTAQAHQQQDLILILAEQELMSDRDSYNGLSQSTPLNPSRLEPRVNRYATQLQQRLHNTKVEIITVSKQDDPATIAAFLKQVYLRNIDASPIRNRYLQGIVLMGEVPLPVVDKNGNRFPSIYPYTDFVDPAYVYNLETGFFELSRQNTSAEFEPEIWHGIIDFSHVESHNTRTPEEAIRAIRNDLAIYLDKNYLYHSGDPNFANFDSKIFYSEPIHEKKALDEVSLANYEKYQRYSEELLYNRFSQKLFNEVSGVDDIDLTEVLPTADNSDVQLINLDDDFPDVDIMMHLPIEEQLVRATDLFQSSLGRQVTALLGTGRFTASDIFTPITAIAQKDDYIAAYFKMVNRLVESQIDRIVVDVQTGFEIPNGAILSGVITYENADGTTSEVDITPQYFLNNSPEARWLDEVVSNFPSDNSDLVAIIFAGVDPILALTQLLQLISNPITRSDITSGQRSLSSALKQFHVRQSNPITEYIRAFRMQVYGRPVANITQANQCRIYRGGGTDNPLDKTVKTTRGLYQGFDEDGTSQPVCYIPFENNEEKKYETTANNIAVTDQRYCSDFFGSNINQPHRVQGVSSINKGALTHESCFNMRPIDQFDSILNLRHRFGNNTPEQVFELSNQQVSINDIVLQVPSRTNIPLRSVLENLEDFTRLRDPSDWNAWSYYLLGNPVKNSFEISGENFPGIESITLNIQKLMPNTTTVPNSVLSIVKHADPTDNVLIDIEQGEVTQELPINATRYLTFVDRDGNVQEITYPNLFKTSTFNDYLSQISQIELLLSSLSDEDHSNQILARRLSDQNSFNENFTRLSQVDQSQLQAFIDWNSFSLSQKYSQVYKNFLNLNNHLDLIGFPQTYEMAVITSETDQDSLDLSILPDDYQQTPLQSLINPDLDRPREPNQEQVLANAIREEQNTRSNRSVNSLNTEQGRSSTRCDDSYVGGIPVIPWATSYIPCWLEAISDFGTSAFSVVRGIFPSYSEKISNPQAEVDSIKVELIGQTFSTDQFSEIPVRISILDSEGAVIVGKPIQVTLRDLGGVKIPANLDVDREKEGVQIFMASGDFQFNAQVENAGSARIQASIDNVVPTEKVFTIHNTLELGLNADTQTVTVADEDGVEFSVQMLNENNEAQSFMPPIVNLKNPDLGRIELVDPAESVLRSEYRFRFVPNTVAAQANIQVSYPGLESETITFRVTPDQPSQLYFPELVTNLVHTDNPEQIFTTNIQLVDQYRNRIITDLTGVNISVSDTSKVELISEQVNLQRGQAEIQFTVEPGAFGNVFLQAEHPALGSGLHQVVLGQGIPFTEFNTFASPALYYELRLDTSGKSAAASTIANGKAQVASTLSTSIERNLPVLYIHRSGAIELTQQARSYNFQLLDLDEPEGYQVAIIDDQNTEIGWLRIPTAGLTEITAIESKQEINSTGIYALNYDPELFELNSQGRLRPLQSGVTFEVRTSPQYFKVAVLHNSQEVSTVYYNLSGATVVGNVRNLNFAIQPGFTGNSTQDQQGIIVYDLNRQINSTQQPGNSVVRTDSALQVANQGLHSGGKSLLLFSAGMSAGESNRPFLSDAGMVFGDPTVKLDRAQHQNGFNQDIGKMIARTDSNITHMVTFEDQVLFADENGNLSRLDLNTQRFYKNLLNVPNGIKQIISSKVRNSEDQLIILTQEGCFEGDSCLYKVDFEGDTVRTVSIDTDLASRAKQIISMDYNNNGSDDLVVLAENNLLYLIRRDGQTFNRNASVFGNIYNQLQQDSNLLESLLISSNTNFPNQDELFSFAISVPLDEPRPDTISFDDGTTQSVLQTNEDITFYRAQEVGSIENLTVTARDINGGLLRDQDKIEYRVSFQTNQSLSNASISLPLSSNESIDLNSLSNPQLNFTRTTVQERPYIITGINSDPGQVVTFTFQTTYSAPTNFSPLMTVVVDEEDPTPDGLPDVKIVLTGQNKIIYYHSSVSEDNRISYQRKEVVLEEPEVDLSDLTGSSIPLEDPPGEDDEDAQKDLARRLRNNTSDSISVGQAINTADEGLANLGNRVADSLDRLRCDGKGCLIMPVNRAFLVPSGQPVLPIFGAGCAPIPFVWPPAPYASCGFRQYISPTLTGEFVGASCVGPFMSAACWTYKIGDLGAACDAINQRVADTLNSAVDMVNTAGGGVITVGGGSGQGQNNVSVPGFPSVLTDWFTAQIREITDKLLDLPDITIIYPSVESLVGYFSPIQDTQADFEDIGYLGIENALAEISSLPLFNVTFEEHELKYPWIPNEDQLNDFLLNFTRYFDQAKTEVRRAANSWGCYGRSFISSSEFNEAIDTVGGFQASISNSVFDNPDIPPLQAQACIQLGAAFDGFYASFTLNLDALKDYRDLPRNLFTVENFIADYADQALQIAEHVLDRTAGFLTDNTQALIEWQQFLYDIQNILDSFRVLIDFAANFIASCDDCRTDRTNPTFVILFEMLFQIPDLPVISFPKLPDITLDFSKIEAGIDIVLPTFRFVPERVSLPDIGGLTLRLPDAVPIGFDFNFGRYGLAPMLELPPAPNLEQFVIDLPDLPEIELPVFPVIPRPPNITMSIGDFIGRIEAPMQALSAFLRVVCIVTKGIVPTPEAFLRSKIESMTNRPLTPVLPIDLGLAFQFPSVEVSYVTEYRIILETYFNLEFDLLATLSRSLVTEFNNLSLDTTASINNMLASFATLMPDIEIDASDVVPIDEIDINFELDPDGEIDDMLDLTRQFNLPESITLVASTEKVDFDDLHNMPLKNLNNIPPQLNQYYSALIAFRESLHSRSSAKIASIRDLPFRENPPEQLIARTVPDFDGPAFRAPEVSSPTFKPEEGLYFVPPGTEVTQKLVAYSAETSLPTNVAMTDYNQNQATDIVYSRGNEIYVKENQSRGTTVNPASGSVRTTPISRFQAIDKSTLTDNKVSVITENRNAIFSLPNTYEDKITVIDIYNSKFDEESKVNRYIINPFGDAERLASFQEINSFNYQGKTIPRDNFSQLYVKNSFTPNVSVRLDNINYRASISTLNLDTGSLEIVQQSLPVTPNVCGDRVPPVFGSDVQTNYTVSLYERLVLDFTDVTDAGSEVVDIYLDTNSDGERNFPSSRPSTLSRQIVLPPFENTGTYRFKAWAVDEPGNRSSIDITVTVVPPNITLNRPAGTISGEIDPSMQDIPVTIIRDRNGVLEEIGTVNTDSNGQFEIDELVESDSIVIQDASNRSIFEVNQATGSIRPLVESANVQITQAENPGDLTTIILRNGQQVITTLTKVADINLDAQVVTQKPSKEIIEQSSNVFVLPIVQNSEISFRRIAGSDPDYAGSITLNLNNQRLALFDTNGGLKFYSPQVTVRLQQLTDLTEFQWYEILYQGQHVASVLPSFARTNIRFIQPQTIERVARPVPPVRTPSQPTTRPEFQDIDDSNPNASIIRYLQENDVIEGIEIDGERFFQPFRQITRAEYAKIILRILCLEPTPPSFQRPSVFSDIPFTTSDLPWYFSETKESYLQRIFTGYLGEIDPISNLPAFKPNNPINLAEATKVVLEALVNQGILDMDSVEESEPWYDSFLEVAQDIRPYLRPGYLTLTDFVITAEEAQDPNRFITREEFAVIAFRVLQINNCLEDGPRAPQLPSQDDFSADDLDQDTDIQDQISEDTDDTDSQEVDLIPSDLDSIVPSDFRQVATNAGLYMQQIICISCPCQYRIEYLATLIRNDILYAIIRNPDTGEIIQRSQPININ